VVRESFDVLDRVQELEIFLLAVALAEVFANLNRNDAAKECCRVVILVAVLHLLITDPIPIPMVGITSPHVVCVSS
jgi:hypothetical protein